MKSTPKRHHHFLSPHRDDAWLTFGGTILSLLKNKEPVTIYILFGTDAYLRPQFVSELAKEGISQKHVKSLSTSPFLASDQKEELHSSVRAFCTIQDETTTQRVGIVVRQCEESLISKKCGSSLKIFDLPCAFPNRGYQTFNSPLNEADSATQIASLQEKLPRMQVQDRVYVVSGIGGHPDHIIAARLGKKYSDEGISVRFGMDFPYSSVLEWIHKSELQLDHLQKEYVDISSFLQKKVKLLSYYASQLGHEDLRLAKQFPSILRSLYRTDFPDSPQEITKWNAVEAMYSIRK